MSDIIKKYDIIDKFDENQYQTVNMAIDNQNYQDIVIINEIKLSDWINHDFIKQYRKITPNLLALEEGDESLLIVNKYEQSKLIADYLAEEKIDFVERLRLVKSFLYQLSDFENLNLILQGVFINLDQITISHGNLKFSNFIFLKSVKTDIEKSDLLKSIGEILETILETHREILTPELSAIQTMVYQLLHNEVDLTYNDLYNRFKVLAAAYNDESVNYTPNFEVSNNTNLILEQARKQRIMRERHPSLEQESLETAHEQVEEIELINGQGDLKETQEDQQFKLEKGSVDLSELMGEPVKKEQQAPLENKEDKIYILDEDFDLDQVIEAIEPEEANEEEDKFIINEEDMLDASVLIEDVVVDDHQDFDEQDQIETIKLTDDIDLDTFDLSDLQESEDLPVTESFSLSDIQGTEDELESDSSTLSETRAIEEKLEAAEHDVIDDLIRVQTQTHSKEIPAKHSVHISYEPDVEDAIDPIQEILDRNDKQHSDLTIQEEKSKKKFLPTFLLFFIILSIITSLLIFYSSTYM